MQIPTAILGAAGAVGRAAVDELGQRGGRPVAIGRDGRKLERLFTGRAEIRAADIQEVDETATALKGIENAVYCAGLPYPQFEQHPALMRRALEAARRAGLRRMIVVSSVYSYGHPRAARVSEEHPREPETRKGRFRKEQEDAAMEAHGRDGLATLVLHLPDFYGPYAANSLAYMMFESLLAGKPARWLGESGRAARVCFHAGCGAGHRGIVRPAGVFRPAMESGGWGEKPPGGNSPRWRRKSWGVRQR